MPTGSLGCPCFAWQVAESFKVMETQSAQFMYSLSSVTMSETGVDQFDPKLLSSIFLLTEGRDVARLRLVCKGWQHNIDDSQVICRNDVSSIRVCTDAPPYARSGLVVQIPKELFKKTWGITETLGEPRKTAMYLVRSSTEHLVQQTSASCTASPALTRFSATNNLISSVLAQAAAPTNFVLQHRCRRWESLISVAVQYLADTTAIRVLNNLTTDHSLRSREYVYVPGESSVVRM